MIKLLLPLTVCCCAAAPAAADLLLTEVFYDYVGVDDTYEWVEILNTGDAPVDLTGYIVAWGGTDYGYGTVVLQGQVEACGVFVVGGPGSTAGNGNPVFDQAVDLNPDIQNGGTPTDPTGADAVALFAPGANVLADVPLDAVIYGGTNPSGLIDETGQVGAPDVEDAPNGSTVARTSAAGSWSIREVPGPNSVDFSYVCGGTVPTRDGSWGTLKSSYR
ncbi:MAG: lamin tail domain-containing protein [Krumholzibacteria bacterium]|nr:lamin tail domain-containing protein [Candidatus Krumholzibacteria bacterium]